MRFRDLFSRVQAIPGMYGVGGAYDTLVAFVTGCDAATDWSLLQGFEEWLVVKVGHGSNVGWPRLVLMLAFPDEASLTFSENLREEHHVRARAVLMGELDAFLAAREHRDGLREVYRTYLDWRSAGHE